MSQSKRATRVDLMGGSYIVVNDTVENVIERVNKAAGQATPWVGFEASHGGYAAVRTATITAMWSLPSEGY